jgi:hypothetical protein
MQCPHLPAGKNDPKVVFGAQSGSKVLVHSSIERLSVIRVDDRAYGRQIHGSIGLVGTSLTVCDNDERTSECLVL